MMLDLAVVNGLVFWKAVSVFQMLELKMENLR